MLEELNTANKKVGIKQSVKAIQDQYVLKAFIAKNADKKVIRDFKKLCLRNSIGIIWANTVDELGKACNIDVGASVAVITKNTPNTN